MTTAHTPEPPTSSNDFALPGGPPPPPLLPAARTSYLMLLRLPGAGAFFAAACAGRLGIAMTSLGLIWLVQGATGSFAVAGAVTATFAVAEAALSPQVARAIDAFGQVRVVPVLVAVHATAMATVITAAGAQGPGRMALFAAAAVAGGSIPQFGALAAARWVHLLQRPSSPTGPSAVPAAFALESVVNAGAYLVGPVAVSALAASGRPAVGSAMAAALVMASGVALTLQRGSAPPGAFARRGTATGHERGHRARVTSSAPARRLFSAAFLVLLAVQLGMGAYFGALPVAITAFAVQVQRPESAPALIGIGSVTGLVAAWAYGRRTWKTSHPRQLVIATTALAACSASTLLAVGAVSLGAALAAAGAAVPVVLVLSSVLAQARVPRAVITQAFTWLNSTAAAGSAAATAIAGIAVEATGARTGLVVTTIATAAIAVVVISTRQILSRPAEPAAAPAGDPGDGDLADQPPEPAP